MTAIRTIASIVLALAGATPALAAEPNNVPIPAPSAPAPSPVAVVAGGSVGTSITLAAGAAAVAAAKTASPNARYCFRTETTGSRLQTKVCKTRSEWEARGVDLDRALAGR